MAKSHNGLKFEDVKKLYLLCTHPDPEALQKEQYKQSYLESQLPLTFITNHFHPQKRDQYTWLAPARLIFGKSLRLSAVVDIEIGHNNSSG